MAWVSLAKTEGEPRVVLIGATRDPDESKVIVGLAFVRHEVKNTTLTMRCLETKERMTIKLADDMRNLGLPGYWINEELEVVSG